MDHQTILGLFGFSNSFLCYWSLNLFNLRQNFELASTVEWKEYLEGVNYFLLLLQIISIILMSMSLEKFKITITGFMLGLVFLLGVLFSEYSFAIYFAVLAFFHFSEFLVTGLTNPKNLSFDSYLVNHSVAYTVAAVSSWIEHFSLLYFVPSLKHLRIITYSGLAVCIVGEILRKVAMFHAGRSFNHLVQDRKADDHVLITSGVYSVCRHPSYVGWFIWTLGTQIILINPFCLIAYTLVTYTFFKYRIEHEEYSLVMIFDDEYRDYQKRVGTGIPFINGYQPRTQQK